MRFFEAAPGRARAIKKKFFAGFAFFTSKWNYCRVTGPQNKIFIKNQLTLLYSISVHNWNWSWIQNWRQSFKPFYSYKQNYCKTTMHKKFSKYSLYCHPHKDFMQLNLKNLIVMQLLKFWWECYVCAHPLPFFYSINRLNEM
jgi:hypothetical protein